MTQASNLATVGSNANSGGTLITSGTSQASTSGTSITFTGIPSSVKRITVMFNGVSTSGSSYIIFQIGTSGGIQTTGYQGSGSILESGQPCYCATFTTGFGYRTDYATSLYSGATQFFLFDSASGLWVASGSLGTNTAIVHTMGGTKTLSGTCDRIRITTVNGTDTFDAGSINILYE
jgi:hypothetical protein